jgi:hypothetical protein
MKAQVSRMEAELREMKEQTIPLIVHDVKMVAVEMRDTNARLSNRFDKIDSFMERLMSNPMFQQQHPVVVTHTAVPVHHPSNMVMVDPRFLSPNLHHPSTTELPDPQWTVPMTTDDAN